ncbi:hypothetical protein DFS34DRAFT_651158 [Phlyctochytrium arcticum]|nr:hypothetical protein DFS34DRAFT_651158 [Phlyctochytrium arcticum]
MDDYMRNFVFSQYMTPNGVAHIMDKNLTKQTLGYFLLANNVSPEFAEYIVNLLPQLPESVEQPVHMEMAQEIREIEPLEFTPEFVDMVFERAKEDPNISIQRNTLTKRKLDARNGMTLFQLETTDYILKKHYIKNLLDAKLEEILENETEVKEKMQLLANACKGFAVLFRILNNEEKQRVENYEGLKEMFSSHQTYYNQQINLIRQEQRASEAFMRNKYIPWVYVKERSAEHLQNLDLDNCTKDELRAAIIVSFYTNRPPRRSKDFSTMSLNKDAPNHYDDENFDIVLNDYKTVNAYGEYVFHVTRHERKMIEAYRTRFATDEDQNLFTGWENRWSEKVASIMQRVVGKPLTSTDMRKLYVSYQTALGNLKYLPERKKMAYEMGHSINLQALNYTFRIEEDMEQVEQVEAVEQNTATSSSSSSNKRKWSDEEKEIAFALMDEYEAMEIKPFRTVQKYIMASKRLPPDLTIEKVALKCKRRREQATH